MSEESSCERIGDQGEDRRSGVKIGDLVRGEEIW